MICSKTSAIWQRLLSFFCAVPLRRSHNSKSAQIILMPRLRVFRKKSSMQKRFAGRLQQSGLQLVWAQQEKSSWLKARRVELSQMFQRESEILCNPKERPAATGTDENPISMTH